MKRLKEYTGLWALGGMLYYGIEVIFRGFSHWSMFVLGGICMMSVSYTHLRAHET